MYNWIGNVSEGCRLWLLSQIPTRTIHKGAKTDFECASDIDVGLLEHPELTSIWPIERWLNALAVNLPPSGYRHKHKHPEDRKKTKHHIVLMTNDECVSSNGDVESHLGLRGVYRMEPRLMHESFNRGATDRLHLILEIDNV